MEEEKKSIDWGKIISIIVNAILAVLTVIFGWNFGQSNTENTELKKENKALVQQYEEQSQILKNYGIDE